MPFPFGRPDIWSQYPAGADSVVVRIRTANPPQADVGFYLVGQEDRVAVVDNNNVPLAKEDEHLRFDRQEAMSRIFGSTACPLCMRLEFDGVDANGRPTDTQHRALLDQVAGSTSPSGWHAVKSSSTASQDWSHQGPATSTPTGSQSYAGWIGGRRVILCFEPLPSPGQGIDCVRWYLDGPAEEEPDYLPLAPGRNGWDFHPLAGTVDVSGMWLNEWDLSQDRA